LVRVRVRVTVISGQRLELGVKVIEGRVGEFEITVVLGFKFGGQD
jgi:hypothetical protein